MNPFKEIFVRKPKRNNFDLSHDRKFSFKMGDLVPILCQEVVPGDRFTLQEEHMLRLAPLVSPVMHKIDAYVHYFFVPNRILWSNWESFITGGEDGMSNPSFPYIDFPVIKGSALDYLGLPLSDANLKFSALPIFAYQKIYNEYYRDQNLQSPVEDMAIDGNNTTRVNTYALYQRAWEHDYFTSALPFAQKGPEVILPLGQTADVVYTGGNDEWIYDMNKQKTTGTLEASSSPVGRFQEDTNGVKQSVSLDNSANLQVDLTTATSSTINELRKAFKLQEWLEANARGGSRYIEHIYNIFGVKSSDARLQRPEYLGGGKSTISVSEVLQTSASGQYADTPQGNMSGHGINVGQSSNFTSSFEEHGYIIGIMSVRPQSSYSQGIPKHFSKFDKFDYFYPQFANIGEQEVKNKELYVGVDQLDPDGTFGYVPRYAEYRYAQSTIHGDFRDILEFWHLGRKFGSPPALNAQFVQIEKDNRIFALTDTDYDTMYCHLYHKINALRPLPLFNVPTI